MKRALLDTDILSYVLDGRYPEVSQSARQYLRVFRVFSISAVTIAEVVAGHEKTRNYAATKAFEQDLRNLEVFPAEAAEAMLAGKILAELDRSGNRIGPLDPFIAATAIENERVLVTNNLKHYQRIVDLGFPLELENWRNANV